MEIYLISCGIFLDILWCLLGDASWFAYCTRNCFREISLEELGIRDMNLTEQVEVALEEEKATTNEAPKTWNTAKVSQSFFHFILIFDKSF